MRRRTFLTSVTAGSVFVAGCGVFSGGDESDPQTAETGNPDPTPTDDGTIPGDGDSTGAGQAERAAFWRDADALDHVGIDEGPTIVTFEGAERTAALLNDPDLSATSDTAEPSTQMFGPIEWSIDFVAGATDTSPARAQAIAINYRADEVTLRLDRYPLLAGTGLGRNSDGKSVYLVPTETHPLAETVPEYQQDEAGRWQFRNRPVEWFPTSITFPPESGFVGEYYLLNASNQLPFAPGQYEFVGDSTAVQVAVWPTDVPGVERTSRFEDADPPGVSIWDEIRWYHDKTPDSRVYLEPGKEFVELPERITLKFINQSSNSMGGGLLKSKLHKLVDGEWFHLAPQGILQGYVVFGPWSYQKADVELYHDGAPDRRGNITVGHLGGGIYAYESTASAGRGKHTAMIEVDAPPITVEREANAPIVDNGSHVIVESPRFEGSSRDETLTVSRTDRTDPEVRLIPEKLYRQFYEPYRNTLPVFEPGVERVTLRTNVVPNDFDIEDNPQRVIEYDGETYLAEAAYYEE